MTRLLIENIRIALPSGQAAAGAIVVDEGNITEVTDRPMHNFRGERLDGKGYLALPGFIDLHIHGAAGADFMDGNEKAFQDIARFLPAEGTTSFLATTMTQSADTIKRTIDCGRSFMQGQQESGAEMLGFHLEGPFIHPEQAGAQPLAFIREPSFELIQQWFSDELELLKVVTLAPEKDNSYTVIRQLAQRGIIVSAGHTKATHKEVAEAVREGLTHLTHYGNAMRGLHHREIGVIGAGLMHDELFCEVIADGVHVAEDMLRLMMKVMGPERIILITDSMRAKGLSDGSYTLAEQQVHVEKGIATLAGGTLAGSVLKMNEAVRRIWELTECLLQDILNLSSANAAKRLGIFDQKGSLAVGKDADIVLVNDAFEVQVTLCSGGISYVHDRF